MNKKQAPAEPADNLSGLKKVFVISPIGSPGTDKHRKATLALDYIIKKALPDDIWEVTRGDGSLSPDSIGHDIIKRINSADLIVADLTDHNANVFYELAIAHGWNKPVIHIIERGQSIPFDIADLRVIAYELSDPASVDQTITTITGMSVEVMKPGYSPITPLTQYRSFENVTASLDPESAQAEMNLQIINRLSAIEDSLKGRRPATSTEETYRRAIATSLSHEKYMEGFIVLAEQADKMTRDRDDYDISSFTTVYDMLDDTWSRMNLAYQEETRARLSAMGIPFPDIKTATPTPLSRKNRTL